MAVKKYLNILAFLIILILAALGLKFKPSLLFIGLTLMLLGPSLIILKFSKFFSKTSTLIGIFIAGAILSVLLGTILLQVKSMSLGKFIIPLMFIVLIIFPNIFTTSLFLRTKPNKIEVFTYYTWFLISLGLVILFLSPVGSNTGHGTLSMVSKNQLSSILMFLIFYLTLTLIPSIFILIYQRIKIFLIFLLMPIVIGYFLSFLLG